MALPTLEKTWQYDVNQDLATSGVLATDQRALMFAIKDALVSFGVQPWTVVSSSDSSSAGASDYWVDAADLVFAGPGVAHSWIVLKQTGLGTNVQLCIDLINQYDYSVATVILSPNAGFTGGSTTARPTATDEVTVLSSAAWTGLAAAADVKLHVMQSDDGQCTRVVICSQSACRGLWILDKLADSSLAIPVVVTMKNGTTTGSTHLTNAYFVGRHSTTNLTAYCGTEYYNTTAGVNANSGAPSDISGLYPITPLSAWSETTGAKGRLGRFQDLWIGSSSFGLGGTYPATPDSKLFAQFQQFVFPWDGSTPLIV